MRFIGRHRSVCHNDDDVAGVYPTGSGTVKADHSTFAGSGYCVSVKPFAIVVVNDENSLAGKNSGGVHQVLIYGDAANIVEASFGNGNAVNL